MEEDDPKESAKEARRLPETEKLLRQFMELDGPKGTSEAYRANYDSVFEADCKGCGKHFKKSAMREVLTVGPVTLKPDDRNPDYICKECFLKPPAVPPLLAKKP